MDDHSLFVVVVAQGMIVCALPATVKQLNGSFVGEGLLGSDGNLDLDDLACEVHVED